MPLSAVAAAVTGKRDIELLAGLPERFTDDRDQQAVSLFRLSPTPSPTCADLMRQADDAGRLPD